MLLPLGMENVTDRRLPLHRESQYHRFAGHARALRRRRDDARSCRPSTPPRASWHFPRAAPPTLQPNTLLDVPRFQADLSALIPGHQPQPLSVFGTSPESSATVTSRATRRASNRRSRTSSSTRPTWAPQGVKLPSVISPNSYSGASPQFARFTQFDSSGQVVGGYGPEYPHGDAFPLHLPRPPGFRDQELSPAGIGFSIRLHFRQIARRYQRHRAQLSPGPPALSSRPCRRIPGILAPTKGPQPLTWLRRFRRASFRCCLWNGWIFSAPWERSSSRAGKSSTSLPSPPARRSRFIPAFNRPAWARRGPTGPIRSATPDFSTRRTVREDYFGRGANNASFFSIPIDVPGGTGPNQGRFGTLGRNTFRGPGFYNLDMALIKDTTLGSRARSEPTTLEFRAEFFNAFNLVTFGLPVNILRGSGFGVINHTAGTSRQIQFSLKLIF